MMQYLDYIKDFDNMMEENERVYELQKIMDSNLEEYINYYDCDIASSYDDETEQDLDSQLGLNAKGEPESFRSKVVQYNCFSPRTANICNQQMSIQWRQEMGQTNSVNSVRKHTERGKEGEEEQ